MGDIPGRRKRLAGQRRNLPKIQVFNVKGVKKEGKELISRRMGQRDEIGAVRRDSREDFLKVCLLE